MEIDGSGNYIYYFEIKHIENETIIELAQVFNNQLPVEIKHI